MASKAKAGGQAAFPSSNAKLAQFTAFLASESGCCFCWTAAAIKELWGDSRKDKAMPGALTLSWAQLAVKKKLGWSKERKGQLPNSG